MENFKIDTTELFELVDKNLFELGISEGIENPSIIRSPSKIEIKETDFNEFGGILITIHDDSYTKTILDDYEQDNETTMGYKAYKYLLSIGINI